jgi:hypothetical protein
VLITDVDIPPPGRWPGRQRRLQSKGARIPPSSMSIRAAARPLPSLAAVPRHVLNDAHRNSASRRLRVSGLRGVGRSTAGSALPCATRSRLTASLGQLMVWPIEAYDAADSPLSRFRRTFVAYKDPPLGVSSTHHAERRRDHHGHSRVANDASDVIAYSACGSPSFAGPSRSAAATRAIVIAGAGVSVESAACQTLVSTASTRSTVICINVENA